MARKLKEKFPHVEIDILPMGSYPCDTKVIDLNEFDFLLTCNVHYLFDMDLHSLHDIPDVLGVVNLEKGYDDLFMAGNAIIKGLAPLNLEQPMKVTKEMCDGELSIVGWNMHGPAQCLELGWRCSNDHYHHIDVDITMAKVEYLKKLKPMCKALQEKTVFKHVYDSLHEDDNPLKVSGRYTTSNLEETLHRAIEKVSPNTLAAFRMLKVLIHHGVPARIVDHPFSPAGPHSVWLYQLTQTQNSSCSTTWRNIPSPSNGACKTCT